MATENLIIENAAIHRTTSIKFFDIMYPYLKRLSWSFYALLISSGFVSCYDSADEELDQVLSLAELKVSTRAVGEMVYPLRLYAFERSTGECRLQKTFGEEDISVARLELPEGKYRLVAMCGMEDCDVPSKPLLSSVVSLPDDNCLAHPLMQGSADLNVSGNTAVDIMMYHSVASLSVSLSDIPEDIAAVEVTFSNFYQTLGFDGEYAGGASTAVSCKKNGGLWESPVIYVLPSNGSKLLLTISFTAADGSKSDYGYTYRSSIVANTPYRFSGSYRGGFEINGAIDVAGWKSNEDIGFTFGVGAEGDDDPGGGSGAINPDGEVVVNSLPVKETIWEGHFIALVENADASGADVLLLGLGEWKGVHGETCVAGEAQGLVDDYTEFGMRGWRIPVKEEVLAMKDAFGIRLSAINQVLVSAGGEALSDSGKDAEKNDIRYLCDGGKKTYTWEVRNSGVTQAGTKRSYYLRAVKKLRMVLKSN